MHESGNSTVTSRSPGEILETLAASLLSGAVPDDEIAPILDLLESDLDGWRERLFHLEVPGADREECERMRSSAMDALAAYAAGIDAFRRYLAIRDHNLLEEGVRRGREGDRSIDHLLGKTAENLQEFGVGEREICEGGNER